MEDDFLSAPIPGESLTTELGSRPWQQPYQYPGIDQAIDFYMTSFKKQELIENIPGLLEQGVSIASIANVIQMSSVSKGLHSIDVGVLAMPVIMEYIRLIGASANVDYKMGDEPEFQEDKEDPNVVALALRDVDTNNFLDSEESLPVETETMEQQPTGLMSRRGEGTNV